MELPFTTPVEAVACFAKAVETQSESAARVASTKEAFVLGPAEGAAVYYQRLVRTKTTLQVLDHLVKATDEVAVVPTAANRAGFPPAPLFFFVENTIGSWRITGITRSPAYAKKVMAGQAPPLLDITTLPSEPDIVPFAERIVAHYDGDHTAAHDVPGIATLMRRWKAFVSATEGNTYVKRTLRVPWFDRAAIQFAHELPTHEEKMWMVANRKGDSWTPVWFGHDFEPSTLFIKLE